MKKQLICICMAALLSLSLLTGCGAGTDTADTAADYNACPVRINILEVSTAVLYGFV